MNNKQLEIQTKIGKIKTNRNIAGVLSATFALSTVAISGMMLNNPEFSTFVCLGASTFGLVTSKDVLTRYNGVIEKLQKTR